MGKSCLIMSKRIRVFYRDFYDTVVIALARKEHGLNTTTCKPGARIITRKPISCRHLMTGAHVTCARRQEQQQQQRQQQVWAGSPLTPDQLTFLQQHISPSSNFNGDSFSAAATAANLGSRNLEFLSRYKDPPTAPSTSITSTTNNNNNMDDFLYSTIFKESADRLPQMRAGYGTLVKDYFGLDENRGGHDPSQTSSSFRGRPYFGKVFGAGGSSQTPYGDRDSRFTLEYNSPSQALNAPPPIASQDKGPNETLLRAVQLLSEITPTGSMHLQQSQKYAASSRKSQYTFRQLPQFPRLWTYQNFTAYVKQLTGSIYLDRSGSLGVTTQQGIVGLILRDLFRSDNRATINCRTTEAYNAAISYFVKLYDLPPVRQLYSQMGKMRVPYDTHTFNILMSAALKPTNNRKDFNLKVDRLALVAEYIRLMCAHEVKASSVTWAILLKVTESLHAKGYVLQIMKDLHIPVEGSVLVDMTRALVQSRTMTPLQVMEYVDTDTSNSVSIPLVNQTMSFVLDDNSSSLNHKNNKERIELCWRFLFRQIEQSYGRVWPSVVTLHTFFKFICDNGRTGNLVQALGPFALFVEEMKVKPAIHTWHILVRAAVSTDPRRPDYAKCVQLMYKLMRMHVGQVLPQTKEWIARARDRIAALDKGNGVCAGTKIDISSPSLTEEERDMWERALVEFAWTKEAPRMGKIPDRKVASFFGFTQNRIQTTHNKKNNKNNHKATPNLDRIRRGKVLATDAVRNKVLQQGPSRVYIDDLVKRGIVRNKG